MCRFNMHNADFKVRPSHPKCISDAVISNGLWSFAICHRLIKMLCRVKFVFQLHKKLAIHIPCMIHNPLYISLFITDAGIQFNQTSSAVDLSQHSHSWFTSGSLCALNKIRQFVYIWTIIIKQLICVRGPFYERVYFSSRNRREFYGLLSNKF